MLFMMGLFFVALGYFQGEPKTMIGGAVAVLVSFFVGIPDVMEMVGFDGERILDAMNGNAD